jgi:hypothetical protein
VFGPVGAPVPGVDRLLFRTHRDERCVLHEREEQRDAVGEDIVVGDLDVPLGIRPLQAEGDLFPVVERLDANLCHLADRLVLAARRDVRRGLQAQRRSGELDALGARLAPYR